MIMEEIEMVERIGEKLASVEFILVLGKNKVACLKLLSGDGHLVISKVAVATISL